MYSYQVNRDFYSSRFEKDYFVDSREWTGHCTFLKRQKLYQVI